MDTKTNSPMSDEGYVKIFSSVLLDTIYLVRDKNVKTPDSSLVKYQLKEVPALKGLSREELRYMHFAKKEFQGEIIQ